MELAAHIKDNLIEISMYHGSWLGTQDADKLRPQTGVGPDRNFCSLDTF